MTWEVGDLAVCVKTKPRRPNAPERCRGKIGKVYRVEGVVSWAGEIGLRLEGKWSDHPTGAFATWGFRKIRPDEHESCEPEFVALLKRSKAPSPQEREKRILEALFTQSTREPGLVNSPGRNQ